MENNNEWFPDRKEKPFLEKFAMVFFGYLIAKYAVKALKKMPRTKVKMRWWMLFASWFMVGLFAMENAQWNTDSFSEYFIFISAAIISALLFSKIAGKEL